MVTIKVTPTEAAWIEIALRKVAGEYAAQDHHLCQLAAQNYAATAEKVHNAAQRAAKRRDK